MKVSSKFFRHKNGISAFAVVGVEATPCAASAVTWSVELIQHANNYGGAVRQGIADALDWHLQAGGSPASFLITEFVELLVDTKHDAVRCAATTAAWKALGHDEAQLQIEFSTEWHVRRFA